MKQAACYWRTRQALAESKIEHLEGTVTRMIDIFIEKLDHVETSSQLKWNHEADKNRQLSKCLEEVKDRLAQQQAKCL
jgi:hypothetical protein